jgi:DnaB helicase-like protein/AAA domain-containing protein
VRYLSRSRLGFGVLNDACRIGFSDLESNQRGKTRVTAELRLRAQKPQPPISSSGSTVNNSLPYNEDAEKGVLCSLLLSPQEVADLCALRLRPDSFYAPAHRKIFELVVKFGDRSKPIDFFWLKQALREAGLLEEVGGPEFLNDLFNFVPSAANAGYYIDLVWEAWARRETILECRRRQEAAFDPTSDPYNWADDNVLLELNADRLPRFEPAVNFVDQIIPKPAEVVSGLINLGTKTTVGGGSKAFKTWSLADLTISIASGVSWLGFETVVGKVLFINLELQPYFFQQRLKLIAKAKNLESKSDWKKNVTVWNLRGITLTADQLRAELKRRCPPGSFSTIVLDPLYRIGTGANESSTADATILVNAMDGIAASCEAAVVAGAHFSKGNQAAKESIDRISGSGVFARDPDAILTFTKHEADGAYTVEGTLRNCPPIEPFCVRWEPPLFVRDESLDPTKLKQVYGRPPKYDANQLLPPLVAADAEGGLTSVEWFRAVERPLEISLATFKRRKSELVQAGKVFKSATNERYQLTPALAKIYRNGSQSSKGS